MTQFDDEVIVLTDGLDAITTTEESDTINLLPMLADDIPAIFDPRFPPAFGPHANL